MIINRVWSMPNSNTFSIPPISEIIHKYIDTIDGVIIDPFANNSKLATITNDLDPQYNTDYHLDATEFLQMFDTNSVDVVLYDPPYSPRQVSECYRKLGRTVDMTTTQAKYWGNRKPKLVEL